MRKQGFTLALFVLTILISGCISPPIILPFGTTTKVLGAPQADYGDAPNGTSTGYPLPFGQIGLFPTLFAADGARTIDINVARLGPGASREVDANDPADPDGGPNLNPSDTDFDDGLVNLVVVTVSIPPPATLTVNVTAPAGSPGGRFYLNVLIDLNMNGSWGGVASNGEPEWVVKNYPVDVPPGPSSLLVTPPAFAFANGNLLPDGAWMRVALTKERITVNNWDGRGQFSEGEIEDHVIRLPDFPPTTTTIRPPPTTTTTKKTTTTTRSTTTTTTTSTTTTSTSTTTTSTTTTMKNEFSCWENLLEVDKTDINNFKSGTNVCKDDCPEGYRCATSSCTCIRETTTTTTTTSSTTTTLPRTCEVDLGFASFFASALWSSSTSCINNECTTQCSLHSSFDVSIRNLGSGTSGGSTVIIDVGPLGGPVTRAQPGSVPPLGPGETIPIEMVALQLSSTLPGDAGVCSTLPWWVNVGNQYEIKYKIEYSGSDCDLSDNSDSLIGIVEPSP